ncbi:DUF5316 family protein [Planococcus salinus]|uniref:DUF5316 domain-containing protein n=1 Tax=Planococcus salinus TaxID=1848460 RepID=A0A3M8P5F7_9BACL|nr:DUF5316 family protein [Planococcus salinus]RNF38907.1 hypothetical protein EEX84_12365 [Planococcus salinus]
MKYFLTGIGVAILSAVIAYLADNWSLMILIAGAFGLICLIYAAILSITSAKGGKDKRNFASERRREQRERSARIGGVLLMAAPNLLLAVIGFVYLG